MFGFSAFGQAPFASLGVSGPQIAADISESVSAADSTTLLNVSFGITETLSASTQQTSQADFYPQVVETDTVAIEENIGGYVIPIDQTDSAAAVDVVYQDQFGVGAVLSETTTATDVYSYAYIPGGTSIETLTANDVPAVVNLIANAYISNISPFLDTVTSPTWATQKSDSPIASNYYGKGLKFIANKTQTLSNISVGAFSVYNNLVNNSTSVTNGSVQLWQLDSNSLSGNPYQLLASREFSVNDLPNPISSLTTITNSLLGAAALSSVTTPSTGSNDDGYYSITLPWSVNYLGVSYTSIHVCTNNYLTFGAGAQTYSTLSSVGPSVPKICMGAMDSSWQRVYYGTEGTAPNRTYRVVYEGVAAASGGVLGSPTIVWEAVFYENNPSQIDIQIGANAVVSGVLWGVYTADAKVGVFPATYTNVGYRLISKPVGQGVVSPSLPVTFDFSSSPVTLTSGVGYAVTFTTGDWATSNRYVSLYKINTTQGVGTGLTLSSSNIPASNILEYNYLLGSNIPIAYQGASTSWFAPVSDTDIYSFAVRTSQDTLATDSISPASSTYYIARTETGNVVDVPTSYIPKFSVFSENSAISAIPDLSEYNQFSSAVFPGSLSDGWGIKFIAQKTGQLGSINFNTGFSAVSVVGSGAVTAGEIRLYQLSSNTLSGTPTTLIATKSIYLTSTTDLLNGLNDGFTNVSGASVTSGVGYAITFYKGTDWSYPACYINNICTLFNNSERYYSSTYVGLDGTGIPCMMVGYATTATDTTNAATLPQTEYRLETVSAADTQINTRQAYGYTGLNNTSGEPVFSTWTGAPTTNGTLPNNNSGGGFFETFIANSTSSVSSVKIMCSSWGNFSVPTTNGYVQIWQLNSNTLGGIPTTLIGQVPFKTTDLLTTSSFVNFDFSSLGISLTSGVGYAVGAMSGSDWNYTTTSTINFYIASVNNPIGDSAGFASYDGSSTWSVDPAPITRLRMAIFSSNNTVDVVNGSPLSYPNMVESVTANHTNTGIPTYDAWNDAYFNGNPIAKINDNWAGWSSGGISGGNARGTGFISTVTSVVGEIRISMYQVAGTTPSTTGTVELWQLASNSLSALPSTLLGSVPLSISDISTVTRSYTNIDFSSQNITVTAGVAYAVVVRPGSDWNSPNSIIWVNDPVGYNGNFMGYNYFGSWSSSTYAKFYISVLPAASNVKDTLTYTTTASGVRTEVESAVDTNTALSTGKLGIQYEASGGDAIYFTKPYSALSGSATGSVLTNNRKVGIGFPAPRNGRLGVVQLYGFSVTTAVATPVSDGAVELWSANTLGGAGQTLLASIPYNPETYNAEHPIDIFDFSPYPGATLTQGQAYILVFCGGNGDWSNATSRYASYSYGPTSGGTASITGLSAGNGNVLVDSMINLFTAYRVSKGFYNYNNTLTAGQAPTAGSLITSSSSVPLFNIFYTTNEVTNGGFTATASETETVTAAGNGESNFASTSSGSILETGTAADIETYTVDTNKNITESGSAVDSPVGNNNTANQAVLENATSAADSPVGLPTYPVAINENSTSAQESSTRSPAFITDITENSTSATETETNYITGTAQRQEIPGTNQIRFPEDFSNSIWSKSNGSITANATTDPEGNTTASLFTEDSTTNIRHLLAQRINGVNISTTWTGSIYVKAAPAGRTQVNLVFKEYVSFLKQSGVYFDISAGTVGTASGSNGAGVPTGTITSAGNGWYRCSITVNLNSTESQLGFEVATASGSANFINGSGAAALYYWGAQVEQGSLTAYSSVANYGNTLTATNVTDNQIILENGTSATETESNTVVDNVQIYEYSNNIDSSSTTWTTSSTLTENSPVTESTNQVIGQVVIITENSTSAVESSTKNIITGQSLLENGTSAADSLSGSTSTANQTVLENGTSAQESEFNTLVSGTQNILENGTSAVDSPNRSVTATRDVTEIGTSQDSATGLPTYPVAINENGTSAAESSTRSAFYAAALLELLTVTNSDSSTNTIVGIVDRLEALVNTLDSSSPNIVTNQYRTESATPIEVLVGATITPQYVTETSSAQDSVSGAKITFVIAVEQGTAQESSTRVISVYSQTLEGVTATDDETAIRFANGLISEIVQALTITDSFKFDVVAYEDLIKATTHVAIYVGAGTALIYPMYITAEVEVLTISAETAV